MNNLTVATIENRVLTEDALLICLSATEKLINKYAYLAKKFKYAGEAHNGANKNELDKYIGYRTLLSKVLYPKYTIAEIQTLIKGEYSSAKCSVKLIDEIVELVKSGDYSLS